MYATPRFPPLPLCEKHALPHIACHLRHASVAGTLKRSRSARARSDENFSAVTFPSHAASKRHFSQSFVPQRTPTWRSSPEVEPQSWQPPQVLPPLRENSSMTSIRVHVGIDEEDEFSERDAGIASLKDDALQTPPPIRYSHNKYCDPMTGLEADLAQRRTRPQSMPLTHSMPDSESGSAVNRSRNTRSVFLLRNSSIASSPSSQASTCTLDSSPLQADINVATPSTPSLLPSPTITRKQTIQFGLETGGHRPVHCRRPTVTSPTLRLFPIVQAASPTSSLDSKRSTSTYGGTTINSSNGFSPYDMYPPGKSVFEDDDEKKGLMEYLKLGYRTKKNNRRSRDWRRLFCCCSSLDDE